MVVSWWTASDAPSIVNYGLKSANELTAQGQTISYWDDAGWNHHTILSNLKPDTEYFYICGDGTNWSPQYSFITAPTQFVRPFIIGMYGDMGVNNSETTIPRIINRVSSGEWDWIFHYGDISYADDHLFKYEQVWNDYFQKLQPAMPYVPYMTTPGNHEYTAYELDVIHERGFKAYNYRFRMPGPESGTNTSMFYSFNYANVHFVAISTETDFPGAPPREASVSFGDQMAWLEEDLKKANQQREKYPWVIVCGHRPMYSSATSHVEDDTPEGFDLAVQQAFEPLFYKYSVDLFVVGHVHNYERMYPVYNDTVYAFDYKNPKATIHLLSGAAGNIEGLDNSFANPPPKWSAFNYGADYGYSSLTVYNNTHLEWKFFTSQDDKLLDSVIIVQQDHPWNQ